MKPAPNSVFVSTVNRLKLPPTEINIQVTAFSSCLFVYMDSRSSSGTVTHVNEIAIVLLGQKDDKLPKKAGLLKVQTHALWGGGRVCSLSDLAYPGDQRWCMHFFIIKYKKAPG